MVLFVAGSLPNLACAEFYSFKNITNNNATDAATGEAQLSLEVTDASTKSGDFAAFTFRNTAVNSSSITDVYFEDTTPYQLLAISKITYSSGVSFTQLAKPEELPGAKNLSPAFKTTHGFSADSDPPVVPNGVNASSEWLTITFSLTTGTKFTDVISALENGDIRVGVHVQGFARGGSESFVAPGEVVVTAVPVPPTALLGVTGAVLMGLGAYRRRWGKLAAASCQK